MRTTFDRDQKVKHIPRRPIKTLLTTAVLTVGLIMTPTTARALLGGPSDSVVIEQIANEPRMPQFNASACILSRACYEAWSRESSTAKQEKKTWWDDVKVFFKKVSDAVTALGKASGETGQNKCPSSESYGPYLSFTDGSATFEFGNPGRELIQ